LQIIKAVIAIAVMNMTQLFCNYAPIHLESWVWDTPSFEFNAAEVAPIFPAIH
jgi:hypothetical protein